MNLKEKIDWEKKKFRNRVNNAYARARTFYYSHETDIRAGAAIAAPLMALGIKRVVKDHNDKKERNARECEHYDWRTHTWYTSRRPLTSREKLELDRMYDEGMSKGEALRRMRLLK